MKRSYQLLAAFGLCVALSSLTAFAGLQDLKVRERVGQCGENKDCVLHVLTESLDMVSDYSVREVEPRAALTDHRLDETAHRLQELQERVARLEQNAYAPRPGDGHWGGGHWGGGGWDDHH